MVRFFKSSMLLLLLLLSFIPSVNAFGAEVTSPYGWRMHPVYNRMIFHAGVDLGVPDKTAVPSVVDGTVVFTGWYDGYGNYIAVQDNKGVVWAFAHNTGFPDGIYPGVKVKKGQIIAISGGTGTGTAPHLHVERRLGYNGGEVLYTETTNPVPYLIAEGWDLTGNFDGWDIWEDFKGFFKDKVSYSMEWQPLFAPSELLTKIFKLVLEALVASFSTLQNNLGTLLVLLMTIDLIWYCIKGSVFSGPFSPETLFPRIIRYGFFIAIWKSWDSLIKTLFIPTFEAIASSFTGETINVESYLNYDVLFNTLADKLGAHLSMKWSIIDMVSPLPFLVANLLVMIVLFTAVSLCIYVLAKIVQFYLICIFGILGIPMALIPGLKVYGNLFIGSILATIFDLICVVFMFGLVMTVLKGLDPVGPSLGSLLLFTVEFVIMGMLVSSRAAKFSSYFTGMRAGL